MTFYSDIKQCMCSHFPFQQYQNREFSVAVCREDEFPCRNQECVPLSSRCNGYPDCRDRSDEENCPTLPPPSSTERPFHPITCAIGQRPCLSGNQCIYAQQWCNGRVDCNDLSDEAHCSKPEEILLRRIDWYIVCFCRNWWRLEFENVSIQPGN